MRGYIWYVVTLIGLAGTINCLQKQYNCPRNIDIHNRPYDCGRAYNKAKEEDYEMYVYKDITVSGFLYRRSWNYLKLSDITLFFVLIITHRYQL